VLSVFTCWQETTLGRRPIPARTRTVMLMSETAWSKDTVGNPLSRVRTCDTCGREPGALDSVLGGDPCPRRDCDGGPMLNDYERRALRRLRKVPSEACQRLANYIESSYWSPGVHEFYAPLEMTDGDIVLRISDDATGYLWLFWAGTPLDTCFYKCISTLPHYQDYKVVSRRNASPKRMSSTLDEGAVYPTHIDDVPEPVKEVMASCSPYPDEWATNAPAGSNS